MYYRNIYNLKLESVLGTGTAYFYDTVQTQNLKIVLKWMTCQIPSCVIVRNRQTCVYILVQRLTV